MQTFNGVWGAGLHGIGNSQHTGGLPIDSHEKGRGAGSAIVGNRCGEAGWADAKFFQQGVVAYLHRPPVDRSGYPHSRPYLHVGRLGKSNIPVVGGGHYGIGEGMLATPFQACGQLQQFSVANPVGGGHLNEGRSALGQGAGFVQHQGINLFHQFQCFSIPDQNPFAGAPSDPHHD